MVSRPLLSPARSTSSHLSAAASLRRKPPSAMEANDIFVSAASAWEITTKHRLGRLPQDAATALDVTASIADQGFEGLSITVDDAERAGRLPGPHRDPFDRMLIAQAQGHGLAIVSVDSAFDSYAVRRLW